MNTLYDNRTEHSTIEQKNIEHRIMKAQDNYSVNIRTIDQQFFMGFSSATIYNAWEDHSAELQYILDNHIDEELEMYLGIK